MMKHGLAPVIIGSTLVSTLMLLSRSAAFPESLPYQYRSGTTSKSRRVAFTLQSTNEYIENDHEDENIASFRDKLQHLYDTRDFCSQFEPADFGFDPFNSSWAEECSDENEQCEIPEEFKILPNNPVDVMAFLGIQRAQPLHVNNNQYRDWD